MNRADPTICINPVVITSNGFAIRANPESILPTGNTGYGDIASITATGPGVVTGLPSS